MNERIVPKSVAQIGVFPNEGPWKSKSGGELNVLFARHLSFITGLFFEYDADELEKIPRDIRGLRMYRVDNIPKDGIGGNEFHRIRQEIIIPIKGRLIYECEDLFGQKRNFNLTPETSIWLPPLVMHSYKALEDDNAIIIVANTLYDPGDKETWDTYSLKEFYGFQNKFKKSKALGIKETKKEINQWPFFRPLF